MRRFLLGSVVALVAWAGFYVLPTAAQQQDNLSLGALITLSAQSGGTVNSPAQLNTGNSGASCTFNQSGSSGSPSTVFSIQFQDTASGLWQSLVTSGAVTSTGPTTPVTVQVYPGIEVSSLPSGVSAAQSFKLPRNWRVQAVVTASTNNYTTGTIGCDLLK
jgi:hypothetical protein